MESDKRDDLDRLIDSVLRNEPERDVPFAFHRGVEERVQIASLLNRERKHFRRCWAFAGTLVGCGATVAAVGWFGAGFPDLVGRAVPGALGSYDHFVFVLANRWPSMALASLALLSAAGSAHYAFARGLSKKGSSLGRA